jgi:hypothetical protein
MTIGFLYPESIFSEYCSQSEALQGLALVTPIASDGEKSALVEAISLGSQQKELDIEMLNRWNELLLRDYAVLAKTGLKPVKSTICEEKSRDLRSQIIALNDALKRTDLRLSPVDKVKLLARTFVKFETLAPYHATNDALARILVNYANSRLYSPIYIFRSSESHELNAAKSDDAKCQHYFAKKIKESAFDSFYSYMKCIRSSGATCFYRGQNGERLTLQWHELDSILA